MKFTVQPGGKFDNGIASSNQLGSDRVIVPVTIIGDQDGMWNKTAWQTEAFYGNPLKGFTADTIKAKSAKGAGAEGRSSQKGNPGPCLLFAAPCAFSWLSWIELVWRCGRG